MTASALCLALAGSLFTPLYEPLFSDQGSAHAAVLGAIHLALGMAVPRLRVFVAPVLLSMIGFVAAGAEGVTGLLVLSALPSASPSPPWV